MLIKGVEIPTLPEGQDITHDYILKLTAAIKSDGCTDVPDFHHDCCVVHDLGYRYEIDPWGRPVQRADIDYNFRLCMQKESPLGVLSPMSWWRWAAVRIFGRYFYGGKK